MPDLYGQLTPQGVLNGSLQTIVYVNNYNDLINKPSINSVELQGNKTAADLGLLTAGDIPVDSVNGKQGVVELDGTDINYSLTKTLNQKIDEVAASIPVVSYPVTSVNSKTGAVVLDDADIEHSSGVSVNSIINTMLGYIPVYGNTASGSIATFDTSLALPLQDCTIAINAVQEGSGTPSPDNVRPITGFTGANIHVADNENPHIIDNVTAITWQSEAGTVYGGSLDVTTGELTVDRAFVTLNGSEEWNNKTGLANIFSYSDPSIKDWGGNLTAVSKTMADTLPTISQTSMVKGTYGICSFSWGHQICVRVENISSAVDLKTYLSSNPLHVVYELATPITYQLTPTQISAIVGTNNVFTDTNGNTSVVYACSLKDYIDGQ